MNRFFPMTTRGAPKRAIAASLAAIFLAVGGTTGCSSTPYVWAKDIPQNRATPDPSRKTIAPGDVIAVTVVAQEALSGQHIVGVDGTISIPNVGAVSLSGRNVDEGAKAVKKSLAAILNTPQVSLLIVATTIEVSILGEVARPGKFQLKSGDGVTAALAHAGGITEFGNENAIYLVRPSEPLRIRFRVQDLVRGGQSARSFALRDGDLLVIE